MLHAACCLLHVVFYAWHADAHRPVHPQAVSYPNCLLHDRPLRGARRGLLIAYVGGGGGAVVGADVDEPDDVFGRRDRRLRQPVHVDATCRVLADLPGGVQRTTRKMQHASGDVQRATSLTV